MFRSWQNETFHLLENTPRHFCKGRPCSLEHGGTTVADSEAAGDAVDVRHVTAVAGRWTWPSCVASLPFSCT